MSHRARRRHHRARMIARATFVQRKWWNGFGCTEAEIAQAARRLADNIKYCSCRGCGNVRRSGYGPAATRQETRADLAFIEGIDDA